MPSVYMANTFMFSGQKAVKKPSKSCKWRAFVMRGGIGLDQFECGIDDLLDRDAIETRMMSLGTYASIAPSARDIVMQHAVRRLPRRVLRIGQGIQIDDRRPECRGNVNRPTVVRDQHFGMLDQRGKLTQFECAGEIHGHPVRAAG